MLQILETTHKVKSIQPHFERLTIFYIDLCLGKAEKLMKGVIATNDNDLAVGQNQDVLVDLHGRSNYMVDDGLGFDQSPFKKKER